MPLNDRLERLYARRRFGMRPGLERMQALMERLGNPERELVTIHVAGTNGKGSVVALAAGMLQACGFGRVGRYTSPHLLCFNERICIDGQPVEDAQLVPVLETVEQAALALDAADALGQTTFSSAPRRRPSCSSVRGVRLGSSRPDWADASTPPTCCCRRSPSSRISASSIASS